MERPSMLISPALTDSRPGMVFNSVDLPQPDGPTSTRKPPLSSVRSIPLRISSAPKRLRKSLISRKAMGSTFHGASHQAAHEVPAGDNVDEESGGGGDDRRGHVYVVFDNPGRSVDEIVERDRHRRLIAGGESRAEQEVVPDVGELVDHRHNEDRGGIRQENAAENLKEARAVDHR